MTTSLKWLGTALQLSGCLVLALHLSWSAWAFSVMMAGSGMWLLVAWIEDDAPLGVLNFAFFCINALGIWRWLVP